MNTYHQDEKQYICQKPLCDKIFNTEDDLIEHVKKCFCCSKCGKYYNFENFSPKAYEGMVRIASCNFEDLSPKAHAGIVRIASCNFENLSH